MPKKPQSRFLGGYLGPDATARGDALFRMALFAGTVLTGSNDCLRGCGPYHNARIGGIIRTKVGANSDFWWAGALKKPQSLVGLGIPMLMWVELICVICL